MDGDDYAAAFARAYAELAPLDAHLRALDITDLAELLIVFPIFGLLYTVWIVRQF